MEYFCCTRADYIENLDTVFRQTKIMALRHAQNALRDCGLVDNSVVTMSENQDGTVVFKFFSPIQTAHLNPPCHFHLTSVDSSQQLMLNDQGEPIIEVLPLDSTLALIDQKEIQRLMIMPYQMFFSEVVPNEALKEIYLNQISQVIYTDECTVIAIRNRSEKMHRVFEPIDFAMFQKVAMQVTGQSSIFPVISKAIQ